MIGADQVASASKVEVFARNANPGAKLSETPQSLEAALGVDAEQDLILAQQEIAVTALLAAPDAAAYLVQLS